MQNYIKTDINVMTGEIIETQMTADEISERELNAQIQAEKNIAQEAAREAAIEHAKTLGFTDAMIAVMYPNLGA